MSNTVYCLPGRGGEITTGLGQHFIARDFDRKVAEIQVCIAVLNGYNTLDILVSEAVG
jgi:hypothetical protein